MLPLHLHKLIQMVTISNDITLTTTNSNVSFGATTNAGTAGNTLTIAAGSGDVTFTDAVGGNCHG
jgi:hypothetical protein